VRNEKQEHTFDQAYCLPPFLTARGPIRFGQRERIVKHVAGSLKIDPMFAKFERALAGSHSNSIAM